MSRLMTGIEACAVVMDCMIASSGSLASPLSTHQKSLEPSRWISGGQSILTAPHSSPWLHHPKVWIWEALIVNPTRGSSKLSVLNQEGSESVMWLMINHGVARCYSFFTALDLTVVAIESQSCPKHRVKAKLAETKAYTPSMHTSSRGIFLHYHTPPSRSAHQPSSSLPEPWLPQPPPESPPSQVAPGQRAPPPSPLLVQTSPPSALTTGQDIAFVRELQRQLALVWDQANEEIWEDCIQFP
ncbi:hypothetical protein EV702DRAFT_1048972 [Suillus placidus]|uniref:Uncharacterized protein n=1 Tax=Suillus placidus TaxID=48579 RepID=A0A9P6ZLK0_9AGAM|nr:hypothetical protein EV702DRAFT_1048972 [Suillus placidus]